MSKVDINELVRRIDKGQLLKSNNCGFTLEIISNVYRCYRYYRICRGAQWKYSVDHDNAEILGLAPGAYIDMLESYGAHYFSPAEGLVFFELENAVRAFDWIESVLVMNNFVGIDYD